MLKILHQREKKRKPRAGPPPYLSFEPTISEVVKELYREEAVKKNAADVVKRSFRGRALRAQVACTLGQFGIRPAPREEKQVPTTKLEDHSRTFSANENCENVYFQLPRALRGTSVDQTSGGPMAELAPSRAPYSSFSAFGDEESPLPSVSIAEPEQPGHGAASGRDVGSSFDRGNELEAETPYDRHRRRRSSMEVRADRLRTLIVASPQDTRLKVRARRKTVDYNPLVSKPDEPPPMSPQSASGRQTDGSGSDGGGMSRSATPPQTIYRGSGLDAAQGLKVRQQQQQPRKRTPTWFERLSVVAESPKRRESGASGGVATRLPRKYLQQRFAGPWSKRHQQELQAKKNARKIRSEAPSMMKFGRQHLPEKDQMVDGDNLISPEDRKRKDSATEDEMDGTGSGMLSQSHRSPSAANRRKFSISPTKRGEEAVVITPLSLGEIKTLLSRDIRNHHQASVGTTPSPQNGRQLRAASNVAANHDVALWPDGESTLALDVEGPMEI